MPEQLWTASRVKFIAISWSSSIQLVLRFKHFHVHGSVMLKLIRNYAYTLLAFLLPSPLKHFTRTNEVDNPQGEVAAPEGGSLEAFHMDHRNNNQGVVKAGIPDTLRVLRQFLLEVNNYRIDKACIQGEASVGIVDQGTVGELQMEELSEVPQG